MIHNSLIFRYCASALALLTIGSANIGATPERPQAVAYYNPELGFKPAQRDFTKIFLQLAGSLEHHSTPEPYIRHVMAEHRRIGEKYKAATGKHYNARPEYLTETFVENLLTNWKKLTPGLKLDELSQKAGRNMRLAIMGSWNMPVAELVAIETQLNDKEAATYRRLLEKPFFEKTDAGAVDAFYASPYERLTDVGKSHLSRRVWLGTKPNSERSRIIKDNMGGSLVVKLLNNHHHALMKYLSSEDADSVNGDTLLVTLKDGLKLEQAEIDLKGLDEYERDALRFSHVIKWEFDQRFKYIRSEVKSTENGEKTVKSVYAMVDN
ncbi:MAG: hypothetical protein EOP09_18160, partial [Proteobacteria bacterium]